MSLRQAAQQALKEMDDHMYRADTHEFYEAKEALRAALAESEQEPVAWMVYTLDGKSVCVTDNPNDFGPEHKALPLYTAPTPRKPLTDDEIAQAMFRADAIVTGPMQFRFAREIERAHGIVDRNN